MQKCECCGNEYGHIMEITKEGETHYFDSFECAIHVMAPKCRHCGCRVMGHGIEGPEGDIYCCAHCSEASGVIGAVDHL